MELKDDVKSIKGIGPKKYEALQKLNIHTVHDLICHYPRTYEDRTNVKTIDQLQLGEQALIIGAVTQFAKGWGFGRKKSLRLIISDDSGSVEVVFFSAGYLERAFQQGETYVFFGRVSEKNGKLQMLHPDFHRFDGGDEQKILSVYPLASGLSQKDMRKWQFQVLPVHEKIQDCIPAQTRERNRLCGADYALQGIHFPETAKQVKIAQFRLIFEELLTLQTGLFLMRRFTVKENQGIPFDQSVHMKEFTSAFPYELTNAQKRVLEEIDLDMNSCNVMNRLVQGDVGSGKTAVAAAAVYKAVRSGYQAVMMAPTELLAKQHYEGLKSMFEPFGYETAFLSGSLGAKEKRKVMEGLKNGEIQFLIGTHAVIQKSVQFQKLGLVITDEQHRFGVNQRALLSEKGENPDVLVMTATPIPRTLAVILYGDLDVSIIDELPIGRKTIETKALSGKQRPKAYGLLEKELGKGRQAYVVAPLIEDSEEVDARSAVSLFEELKQKLPEQRIGLLHGAMKQRDKDETMLQFYQRQLDVLVATVVIEVGINVPNSTVMIVENAERFGLAQLHQLRGRVGRGSEQSYCMLITEGNSEVSRERASIMAQTNDGFVIAEKDLELRGPGEFFGMRQHGMPELKLADLVRHRKILETVKEESILILEDDYLLEKWENQPFKSEIERMFEAVQGIQL